MRVCQAPDCNEEFEHKICTKCGKHKPIGEFGKQSATKDGLKYWCKFCDREDAKVRGRTYKRSRQYRNNHLMFQYGISLEQYEAMYLAQDGKCACCSNPETRAHPVYGGIQRLSVDHNHVTNKVRGLLCARCNLSIGALGEDLDLLRSIISYLETHNG